MTDGVFFLIYYSRSVVVSGRPFFTPRRISADAAESPSRRSLVLSALVLSPPSVMIFQNKNTSHNDRPTNVLVRCYYTVYDGRAFSTDTHTSIPILHVNYVLVNKTRITRVRPNGFENGVVIEAANRRVIDAVKS